MAGSSGRRRQPNSRGPPATFTSNRIPKETEFARQYPKDGPPGIFGGFGCDAVYLLAEGLRAAGGNGGAKLRDALEHLAYTGVTGSFRLSPSDHNGLGLDAVELVRAENGNFVVVR